MNYELLASGSSGNCLIIENKMAIDMGVSFSKIKKYVNDLKVVLLTHQHSDHLNKNTIHKLAKERPTLKFVCGSFLAPILIAECRVVKKNIIILETNKTYDLGMFKCKMHPLFHDVLNVGYTIWYQDKKIFYATDTGRIDHIEEPNCDYVFLEANYDKDLLEKHIHDCINNGDAENKLYYLERASATHLSNVEAYDFILKNMKLGGIYCFLHKSSYNYEQ